jgi:GH43 family beta-xylosidase
MRARPAFLFALVALLGGCGDGDAAPDLAAADGLGAADAALLGDGASRGPLDAGGADAGPPPCTSRLTYGKGWIHPPNHPEAFDVVPGTVTWDGSCTDDGPNSYALLSNGLRPYFVGNQRCSVAIDRSSCPGAPPGCTTRITYAPAWIHPPNHPEQFDVVQGFVDWDGLCDGNGAGGTVATLSNGWRPNFVFLGCGLSVLHDQCGPQFVNPVVGDDCADPGLFRDGADWFVVCTSGNAPDAFPIRRSRDLVHWERLGHLLPSARRPAWAKSDFWAPEVHSIGGRFVAYYTARQANGRLAIGAASATSPLGPYIDLGQPLVADSTQGLIDATAFVDGAGKPYLIWKVDGNATGQKTPLIGQPLAPDGLSLTGSATQLLTNDRPWEGPVVEGPWVQRRGGVYYLFYSGASYFDASYAVGVAQSTTPLGPYTKRADPILVTANGRIGPGHCSVADTPSGETIMLYHAWRAGHVNGPLDARQLLVDRVNWTGGWPSLVGAPSNAPQRVPVPGSW